MRGRPNSLQCFQSFSLNSEKPGSTGKQERQVKAGVAVPFFQNEMMEQKGWMLEGQIGSGRKPEPSLLRVQSPACRKRACRHIHNYSRRSTLIFPGMFHLIRFVPLSQGSRIFGPDFRAPGQPWGNRPPSEKRTASLTGTSGRPLQWHVSTGSLPG